VATDQHVSISRLPAEALTGYLSDLGDLLHTCVHAGANINFVLPFTLTDSRTFWRSKVFPAVEDGARLLWVANVGSFIAGTVQLDCDMPPNQPHRAEVTKLMVHPDFRRRGIGRALMSELETMAGRLDRYLITLDTRTGDAAEPLYRSIGYETVGTIPDFCRDPFEERFHPTTVMYKALGRRLAVGRPTRPR